MKVLQRLGVWVLCCFLLPLVGQAAPPTKAPLVIAHVAATSGRFSLHAEADRRGAALAIEEFNARGGVLGREVVLVSRDSTLDPQRAAQVAEELINKTRIRRR